MLFFFRCCRCCRNFTSCSFSLPPSSQKTRTSAARRPPWSPSSWSSWWSTWRWWPRSSSSTGRSESSGQRGSAQLRQQLRQQQLSAQLSQLLLLLLCLRGPPPRTAPPGWSWRAPTTSPRGSPGRGSRGCTTPWPACRGGKGTADQMSKKHTDLNEEKKKWEFLQLLVYQKKNDAKDDDDKKKWRQRNPKVLSLLFFFFFFGV